MRITVGIKLLKEIYIKIDSTQDVKYKLQCIKTFLWMINQSTMNKLKHSRGIKVITQYVVCCSIISINQCEPKGSYEG